MKTNNIYLIGYMGAGKTTVGKELEKLISYKFQDMDELIVEDSNMEITEIFASKGEARRMIKSNAVSINKEKITEEFQLSEKDLLNGKYILAQKGKKSYFLIIVS